MRFARYITILITLLSVGLAYGQKTSSPAARNQAVSPVSAGPGTPDIQTDWREKLAKNKQAPVKIMVFFDYQCPYCASTIPALQQVLQKNSSQVQLILKHVPLSMHPDSPLAHQAALAAAEQGKFWQMNDLLFAHQKKIKLPDLLEYARQLNLDLPLFQRRLRSGYYKGVIDRDWDLAASLGVDSTPTFFVNGNKLVGEQTPEQLQSAIEGKPIPGTPDVNQLSVAGLDLSHSPVLGPADAPITILEFSDMQCPFCARVVPTIKEVMKQYPTQIKWVFKNFPLDFHADSQLAHQAALAAGQQGKFWEMHDLVFTDQASIKRDDLLQKARRLNLDMAQFTADLESSAVKNQIESDKQAGIGLRVDGTPTFYVNGQEYSGAISLEQFQTAINKQLTALGQPVPVVAGAASPSTLSPKIPEVSFGSPDAPITLVWFSDLQSSLNLRTTLLVRKLIDSHPGQIRLVFKNRPLEIHPGAMLLHEAAMAANAQGKFWQMHDLIIASPQKATREDLMAYARNIGLDSNRFQQDLDAGKYRALIEADLQEAQHRAVLGSPVFFLNSARIDGLQNEKLFNDLIGGLLAAKK
ncbi:MAG TPA: thioredoxin domain-containing protein [Candidatus Angelobacter sp.]|nr:thioredoxin domain-containing protein [Candidatus Angelobacter sp.]